MEKTSENLQKAGIIDSGSDDDNKIVRPRKLISVLGSKFANRSVGARSWAALLFSIMMIIPMAIVIGQFVPAQTPSAGPAPVDLGSAGNYTIFALTGIDTTPGASIITGDIGTGPGVTSTAITGFALSHTVATPYATSPQVSGKVYAFDYSNPTPANVTLAKADMISAYLSASGLPAGVGPFLNVGGGTVSDVTLIPGVYTWTTSVNIPTDLTFSGTPSDVWVLQISGTLDMASAKNVLMIGGAQPQNIFWQVSEAVTIGAGTHFEGIILGGTSITFGNGASINGRLLSQTAVNIDMCAVTEPSGISTYALTLIPGWNLISIPTIETSWLLAGILSPIDGQYDTVQTFEAETGMWRFYSSDAPMWTNTLVTMDGDHGYWIFVTAETSIQLPLFGPMSIGGGTVTLNKGWNLMGYPTGAQNLTVSMVFAGVAWDLVQRGDQTEPYNLKLLSGTYDMNPGKGYWVHVTEDGSWTVPTVSRMTHDTY